MSYTPVNEDEYKARNLWPKGWYPCTVKACVDGTSQKTGDAYFKAEIHVYNQTGAFRIINPTIIMAQGKAAFQLREAAEAFGMLDAYKGGTLKPHDLVEKSGYVKLGVEEDENGQYEPKNVIRGYKAEAPKTKKPAEAPAVEQPVDDDIPF